jgi:hypothetical protein
MFEIEQLRLQVCRRPKQGAVQELTANRADQPFYKGMGPGCVWHRFYFFHFKHPEIGLPLGEAEKRIVIRTEAFRDGLLLNRLMEHSAQRHAIDGSGVNTKSNDSPRVRCQAWKIRFLASPARCCLPLFFAQVPVPPFGRCGGAAMSRPVRFPTPTDIGLRTETFLQCDWKRNRKHCRPFTFGGDSRLARTTGAVEHRCDIQATGRGAGTDTGIREPQNLVRLPGPHGPL